MNALEDLNGRIGFFCLIGYLDRMVYVNTNIVFLDAKV